MRKLEEAILKCVSKKYQVEILIFLACYHEIQNVALFFEQLQIPEMNGLDVNK